jgi:hypothetical protein
LRTDNERLEERWNNAGKRFEEMGEKRFDEHQITLNKQLAHLVAASSQVIKVTPSRKPPQVKLTFATPTPGSLPFETLPCEIMKIICQDFSPKDFASLCQTSTTYRDFFIYKNPCLYFRALYLDLLRDVRNPPPELLYIPDNFRQSSKPRTPHIDPPFHQGLLEETGEGENFNPLAFFRNLPEFLPKGRLPIDRARIFFDDLAKFEAAYPEKAHNTFHKLPLYLLITHTPLFVTYDPNNPQALEYIEQVSQDFINTQLRSLLSTSHAKFSLEITPGIAKKYDRDENLLKSLNDYLANILNTPSVQYLRLNMDAYPFILPSQGNKKRLSRLFPNLKALHLYATRAIDDKYLRELPKLEELVIQDYQDDHKLLFILKEPRSKINEFRLKIAHHQSGQMLLQEHPNAGGYVSTQTLSAINSASKVQTIRFLQGHFYLPGILSSLQDLTRSFYGFRKVILHLPSDSWSTLTDNIRSVSKFWTEADWLESFFVEPIEASVINNGYIACTNPLDVIEIHSPYTGDITESVCLRTIDLRSLNKQDLIDESAIP